MSSPKGRFLLATAILAVAFAATPSAAVVSRDDEPVVVAGTALPDFLGDPIADLYLFRYDSGSGSFVPIPFQIDERFDHVFNPGTAGEFTENIYDLFAEDDLLLDGDDEVAFLFKDGGDQAPAGAAWPAGADPERYEIAVTDPRAGAPVAARWFYLFRGNGLATSPTNYVSWVPTATGDVVTSRMEIEYDGNWLLTEFRVVSPCGTGVDLIDRLKGRAVLLVENQEDEERWNDGSSFLGSVLGPVRAIRYIRGAASGVNTIHHDIFYEAYWRRNLNLRVHPVDEVSTYFDWLPQTAHSFYSPDVPSGVTIDGTPDTVSSAWAPWNLVRSAAGGMSVLWDVPLSPLYGTRSFLYRDDAAFDDEIPNNPAYADDDDAAYGNHGPNLSNLLDSNLDAIVSRMTVFPLCSDVGDGTLGAEYQGLAEEPLQVATVLQGDLVPIRTLALRKDGDDVILEWTAILDATGYRVYVSQFPDVDPGLWTPLGDTTDPSYTDDDALLSVVDRYYSVVASDGVDEGPW